MWQLAGRAKGHPRHGNPPMKTSAGPWSALGLHLIHQRAPGLRGKPQHWSLSVPGVAHDDPANLVADLDARAAVTTGVAALAPANLYLFHRSSATFKIKSREVPRGNASDLSLSNSSAARSKNPPRPVVCPSTAVSRYK